MNIQLNIYNRQTTEGWIDEANKREGEVILMISRGINRPHDVNLHWDSRRGLDSLIEEMERMLTAMKDSRRKNDNSGLKIVSSGN